MGTLNPQQLKGFATVSHPRMVSAQPELRGGTAPCECDSFVDLLELASRCSAPYDGRDFRANRRLILALKRNEGVA